MPPPPVLQEAWDNLWGRLGAWEIPGNDRLVHAIERLQNSPMRSEDVWTLIEVIAFVINAERRKSQRVATEATTAVTTAVAEVQRLLTERLAQLPPPSEY